MEEGVEFESTRLTSAGFQDQCLKPLGQPSIIGGFSPPGPSIVDDILVSSISGGDGEIRILAPIARPIALAERPLQPLEYVSVL